METALKCTLQLFTRTSANLESTQPSQLAQREREEGLSSPMPLRLKAATILFAFRTAVLLTIQLIGVEGECSRPVQSMAESTQLIRSNLPTVLGPVILGSWPQQLNWRSWTSLVQGLWLDHSSPVAVSKTTLTLTRVWKIPTWARPLSLPTTFP